MTMTVKSTVAKYRPIAEWFVEAIGVPPSANTYGRLAHTGRIRAVKILGQWMCTEEDFLAYLEAEAAASIRRPAAARPDMRRSENRKAKAQAEAVAYLEANGIK